MYDMGRRRRNYRRPRRGSGFRPFRIALVVAIAIVAAYAYTHRQDIARLVRHRPQHMLAVRAQRATATPAESVAPAPTPTAIPTTVPSGAARVAIIIDDCGYSMARDGKFLTLPIPVTLSVLPMTPNAHRIADAATAAGKSVILHLPMEPEVTGPHSDPGPGVITTSMTDDEIQAQVEKDLAALPPVRGANNHMGSKATSDARVMRDVLQVFARDHLFFIDSETSTQSVGLSTAQELGVPTAMRDVFLDNVATQSYVEDQLRQAQAVALKRGQAIAIGHPNEATMQALVALIPQMQAAGIIFVPAAELVR